MFCVAFKLIYIYIYIYIYNIYIYIYIYIYITFKKAWFPFKETTAKVSDLIWSTFLSFSPDKPIGEKLAVTKHRWFLCLHCLNINIPFTNDIEHAIYVNIAKYIIDLYKNYIYVYIYIILAKIFYIYIYIYIYIGGVYNTFYCNYHSYNFS